MRTEYELRRFVIGTEGSKERRWLRTQCQSGLPAAEHAMLDRIAKDLGGPYTPEEIEAAEPEHWRDVLSKHVLYELNANGRVSVETQRKLDACGLPLVPGRDYVREIEDRFLKAGKVRVVICIPTAKKEHELERDDKGTPTHREFDHLTRLMTTHAFNMERQIFCGYPTDDAYNHAVNLCFDRHSDFMLCIEDDHEIPETAFLKLWEVFRDKGPKAIVAAWYRQRGGNNPGAPIVMQEGNRRYLEPDDRVHECFVVPQGFTLIPMSVFRELPYPWFKTTPLLTQDSFFCQLAREKGYRLWCDTSVRIPHIDRVTGKVVA